MSQQYIKIVFYCFVPWKDTFIARSRLSICSKHNYMEGKTRRQSNSVEINLCQPEVNFSSSDYGYINKPRQETFVVYDIDVPKDKWKRRKQRKLGLQRSFSFLTNQDSRSLFLSLQDPKIPSYCKRRNPTVGSD